MNESIRRQFEQAGQGQVFRFFESLSALEREELLREASGIDLEEIAHLVKTLVLDQAAHKPAPEGDLSPASYIPVPDHGGSETAWKEARQAGEKALRQGRVAAFVAAGGQGTRLGFDAPKGTFPVTPVTGKSLFQVFAEKIETASRRYRVSIPWFILTSRLNHAAIRSYFEEHRFFGLPAEDVFFLVQGVMPAVDLQGKILLEERHRIALSPDGHGGSLRALVREGAVEEMKRRGMDLLSYFQVDNPLLRCLDPAFVGFHLLGDSEMTSKACVKAYPTEKVGVFVRRQNQIQVVEYSDLPPALAQAHDPDGALTYRAASIGIHLFARDLVERLGSARPGERALPFHRALKKVPTVDGRGHPFEPTEANGVKFEAFVFDAIPLARNPILMETLRQEEFSPVKNAEGVDSPLTCRNDQLRQFARWANAAAVTVPVDGSGLPEFPFEISPLYADSAEEFLQRVQAARPSLGPGTVLA